MLDIQLMQLALERDLDLIVHESFIKKKAVYIRVRFIETSRDPKKCKMLSNNKKKKKKEWKQ